MPISTPHTLIRLLETREVGPQTWKTLVSHYSPAICEWCQKRGLQLSDAENVTQDVLIKMFRRLHAFEYDPAVGFRPYLLRLIQSALIDCVEQLRKFDTGEGETLDGLPARAELEQVLRERFDHELMAEAMIRVARQIKPRTWEAFRRLAFGTDPVVQIAAELGMNVAAVYKARSNIQKRLRDEVRALEGADTGEVGPANPDAAPRDGGEAAGVG